MRNDVRSLWCWKSQKSALLARASIHVPIPQTTKLRSNLHKNNFDMLPLCYFHQLASFKGVGLAKCHADSVAPCCCIWLGWFPPWPGPGLRAFFFTSFETAPRGRNGSAHPLPCFRQHSARHALATTKPCGIMAGCIGIPPEGIIGWCETFGFFWRNGLPHLAHLVHPCWDRLVAGPCKLRSAKKSWRSETFGGKNKEVYWTGWYTNVNPVAY